MMLNRRSRRKGDSGDKTAIPLRVSGVGGTSSKQRKALSLWPLKLGVLFSPLHLFRIPTLYSQVRTLPRKQYFFVVVCVLAVAYVTILRPISLILFGPRGSPIGGALGIFVDANLRWYLFREAVRAWEERLNEKGVALPKPPQVPSTAKLKTIPNFALGETMLRELKRRDLLASLAKSASKYERECLSTSNMKNTTLAAIPKVIFQPLNRPRVFASPSFELLTFSQSEMDRLVKEHFETLYDRYRSLPQQERAMLLTLCALYVYGGVHISEGGANELVKLTTAIVANEGGQDLCAPSVGYAVIPVEIARSHLRDIPLLAVSPRHPLLRCIIGQAFDSGGHEDIGLSSAKFWHAIKSSLKVHQEERWILPIHECGVGDTPEYSECCQNSSNVQVNDTVESSHRLQSIGTASHTFVFVRKQDKVMSGRVTSVSVHESKGTPDVVMVPKVSLREQVMRRTWCESNWVCNRCLKTPIYGSYSRCSFVCGKCAKDIICDSPDAQFKKDVAMEVRIEKGDNEERLIPRIIHQTWFEELTLDRYPQLVRLQNSWQNAGWEYRFYDDASIETYIEKHFPSRFLDAFKALQPGAYKADFFRYLVLLKDGGVYADVDVMLNANLDVFVTPSMSFFAPRDAVGEHAQENFCLWNGFIGSAPGHPFMVRAVERMLNLVLNRADLYDLERDICRKSELEVETWKSRIEPNLLLSGPCALGVSVNEAMGRDSVAKFDVGWLKSANSVDTFKNEVIPGDALILMLDKTDLGALRLSDLERSFVVATTDLPGVSKVPLVVGTALRGGVGGNARAQNEEGRPHYSLAGRGDWLWGTKFVYDTSKMVANEQITLAVSRPYR